MKTLNSASQSPRPEPPRPITGLPVIDLKLFIARSTPNSVRAEQNLKVALESMHVTAEFRLEIVDVFTNGKRAIVEGVVVTPTLVINRMGRSLTVVGDLSDAAQLLAMLGG